MQDAKQSCRGEESMGRSSSTYQRTGRLHQLQLWLRRIHVQSAAALGLSLSSLRGRLGDPHPCDARVGWRRRVRCALAVAAAIVVAVLGVRRRLILRGGLGRGVRCRWRGILIADRLYYRIIRLGFLLLLLCLRRRRSFLFFLSLLVL
jgi:hypothetical protein